MLKKMIVQEEKGFTLIELIIVIAIIAALGSYVIAKQPKVMESQKQAKHVSTIATLESAFDSFGIDEELIGALDSKNNNDLALGEVLSSNKTIEINPDRDNFNVGDDGEDGIATLLMPITERHPLVTQGYINKAPENPWNGSKKYQDYVYVADFKVVKKVVTNPDGTKDQDTSVQPVVRLMRIEKNVLTRTNFILVVNNKTVTTDDPKSISYKALKETLGLYGYDFEDKTSGDEEEDKPDFSKLF